ncbi:hypothetical protein [Pseudomonas sp. LP_7_YM]|uniref:hypothetical protein n=1 Tax=Pseudomonas sp. LP_7_YM TaxID=2485137 RepID=UPI00105B6934|nr:hypothetical protein [Pseudomonas sp. LP_7_YM]TDV58886.1 hypothetical protein EC915_1226 [Pseudomonas sp. LP_7_YM]
MIDPTQNNADLFCDVCGGATRLPGHGQQFGTLQASWGDGCAHDGERYQVQLCEACFFQALANPRHARRIHHLFDEPPVPDDPAFGRVARDDLGGES